METLAVDVETYPLTRFDAYLSAGPGDDVEFVAFDMKKQFRTQIID
jgi:hypothetical protein